MKKLWGLIKNKKQQPAPSTPPMSLDEIIKGLSTATVSLTRQRLEEFKEFHYAED